MNILKRSLSDYFSFKFLALSFATVFIPFLVLGTIFITGGNELFDLLTQGANTGDFASINESEYPILTAILKLSLIKWLIITLFYTIGTVFLVLLSLLIAIIVLGFLTPIVVKTLHKKYYQNIYIEQMESLEVIKQMTWVALKFILLFILCLPFSFIPFVIHIPFFYIFYKFMSIDIASNMMSKDMLKIVQSKYKNEFLMLSLCFFILSLIPIIGIFLQLFFVIYFTHFYFQRVMGYDK